MKTSTHQFIFVLFSFVTATITSVAQAPDTLWTRSIGGDGSEAAYAVFPTDEGDFIIGGYTSSFGSRDFYFVKTDEQGEVIDEKTFGEPDRFESLFAMIKTSEGGYLLAGNRAENDPYSSFTDIFMVKVDPNGNETWTSIFGEAGESETPYSVAQTPDGGYILCGSSWVSSQTGFDIFLTKTNSVGSQEWTEYISLEEGMADYGYWVEVASDGGYLVTGKTQALSGSYSDNAYILKTSAVGAFEWLKLHGDSWPMYEATNRILKTSDGGFLICGFQNNDGIDNNWFVVKTDENGDEAWQHSIGGSYHDKAFNACETSDGGFAVTGNYHQENWYAFITKYNAMGDTLWTKMWGIPGKTHTNYDIRQLDDGSFITVGSIAGTSGISDIYLTKLAPEVNTSSNHKLFVSGETEISRIYPNPFNSSLMISYEISTAQSVTISICNIFGNELATTISAMQPPGNYCIELNTMDWTAGVYVCRLTSHGKSDLRKIIKTH